MAAVEGLALADQRRVDNERSDGVDMSALRRSVLLLGLSGVVHVPVCGARTARESPGQSIRHRSTRTRPNRSHSRPAQQPRSQQAHRRKDTDRFARSLSRAGLVSAGQRNRA